MSYYIHTFVKRGSSHKNFCEDFVFSNNLTNKYHVNAIFDGCSSGKDSHFASTLLSKILSKICKSFIIQENESNLDDIMKLILHNIVCELVKIKSQLSLNTNELLSTIILMVTDLESKSAKIISVGDGFISINGKQIEIEQDNQPDYIAYHISEIADRNKFDKWFDRHQYKFNVYKIEDVSIASDGIFTFHKGDTLISEKYDTLEFDPVKYLTEDTFLIENSAMLGRKCNILKYKHFLTHLDDLSVVRIVKKNLDQSID